jgi:hypothetical protein
MRRLAWRAARAGVAVALAPDGDRIARRVRVDEHWRRHELDGRAPRLTSRETIRVGRPVGRWRRVDPLVPYDGWRRPWAWAGLGLWAGVAGALGFLGWKTGRGPLAGLGHLDEFGDALPGPFDDEDRVGDGWSDDARWSDGARSSEGQRRSEGDGRLDDGPGRWSD